MDQLEGMLPEQTEAMARLFEQKESAKELTLERAQGLVWKGFELSQGDNMLLKAMWRWVSLHYPDYKVNDAMMNNLKERLRPAFKKLILPGPENPSIHTSSSPTGADQDEHDVDSATDSNLLDFQAIMNNKSQKSLEPEAFIIDQQIIKDHKFLVTDNGRPGDPGKKDIWSSNVCRFVLKNPPDSTGYHEYDAMWEAIRIKFIELVRSYGREKELSEVVEVYNKHHLDSQVASPLIK
jgi:hypothetical protein